MEDYIGDFDVSICHPALELGAGETTTVAMSLVKTGMKLLSHHKHARAYLYLHPSGGLPAGTAYVGGEILLALNRRQRLHLGLQGGGGAARVTRV